MIDQVEIEVVAGKGGDGIVSFRREKFVPHGGPDGGDGGRGGAVGLVADRSITGLGAYRASRVRAAQHGQPGSSVQRRGASGEDLWLPVPLGCVVWDLDSGEAVVGEPGAEERRPFADLAENGARAIVARGGRGGWGNKRFATATRRTPRFAQRGMAGERRRLRLELKLLADIGLVGLPNAGKSTLLGAWSAAHPKVAPYPFTTLEPELGVVELGYDSFVAADMPGLIEGASQGVGLGHEFLRHIERTRVLVHVLDMARDDPFADRELIDRELAEFGHGLADKPQLLALNKIDDPDARAHVELLEELLDAQETPWLAVSAASLEGTRQLAERAFQLLREQLLREEAEVAPPPRVEPREVRRERFQIERDELGGVVVRGRTPEWLAATFDLEDDEAREELLDRLRRLGLARALSREGVTPGTTIHVGAVALVWE
ncbi:MAG: GTPase ObgE [Chloroflexi bacterium]|nr:GTPase ObgE [Chloroflexota bacterium]